MLHVDQDDDPLDVVAQDDDPLDVVDLDVADVTDVARGAVVMLCCF